MLRVIVATPVLDVEGNGKKTKKELQQILTGSTEGGERTMNENQSLYFLQI